MKIFGKDLSAIQIVGGIIALAIVLLTFFIGFLPALDSVWGWVGLVGFLIVVVLITVPFTMKWLIGLFKKK